MSDNHNQAPTPSHALDFVRAFDGSQPEISKAEQEAVATRFSGFVEDIMLQNIGLVYNRNRNPEWPINVLDLQVEDPEGIWYVAIRKSDLSEEKKEGIPAHRLPDKVISMYFVDNEDNEHEEHIYGLGHDRIVRREDNEDDAVQDQIMKELGEEEPVIPMSSNTSDEVRAETFKRLFARAAEAQQNIDLEMDMGLHNQPIDMAELEGLISFLTGPKAAPVTR